MSYTPYRLLNYTISKKTNIPVLSINYRRAPENPFPAGLYDCFIVYTELLTVYKPENIAIIGDSSGGNFVFAVMLLMKENNIPLPGAAIGISPWLDLTNTGETFETNKDIDAIVNQFFLNRSVDWYLVDSPAEGILASPLFGETEGFPPVYLTASSSEMLLSDSLRMFYKLADSHIDVTIEIGEGILHEWIAFGVPESERTTDKICHFINAHL